MPKATTLIQYLFVITSVDCLRAYADELRLVLRPDGGGQPQPCAEVSQWAFKPLAPICENEQHCAVIKNQRDELKTHVYHSPSEAYNLENCFIVGSKCRLRVDKNRVVSIAYGRPYPTIYGASLKDFIYNLREQTVSGSGESSKVSVFLPIDEVIGGQPAKYNAPDTVLLNAKERYHQVKVSMPKVFERGVAWCRERKMGSGYAMPDHCVITDITIDNVNYVLAEFLHRLDVSALCPYSWSPSGTIEFILTGDREVFLFVNQIKRSIQSAPLNFDPLKTESFSTAGATLIESSTGVHKSGIDNTKLEQVDLTLRLEELSPLPEMSNAFDMNIKLNAYVNTQKTALPDDWTMPSSLYYQQVSDKVINAVISAYRSVCKIQKKDVVDKPINGYPGFRCQ